MIAGIILITLILLDGLCLGIGYNKNNIPLMMIGGILSIITICFLFAFLDVNSDTIQNWLKI